MINIFELELGHLWEFGDCCCFLLGIDKVIGIVEMTKGLFMLYCPSREAVAQIPLIFGQEVKGGEGRSPFNYIISVFLLDFAY